MDARYPNSKSAEGNLIGVRPPSRHHDKGFRFIGKWPLPK